MPSKLRKSRGRTNKVIKRIHKNSKLYTYRHVTKAELIKNYENLIETGNYCAGQFESLRKEYLSLRDKNNNLTENNRELASRNAALLHENEVLRSQLAKFTKDSLIKISGAEKDYESFKKKLMDQISNYDPFFILKQDFEKSLSVGDITHLDSIATVRNSRLTRCMADETRHQERIREKINNIFIDRIDLTAMEEEPSPISSARQNGSTFSVDSPKRSLDDPSSSHLDFTTLIDRPINSTMIETPSFRRIVPKTPQLDNEPSLSSEDGSWEYNSANIKVPNEPMLSISLDSIQNFIPKTPSLTQPGATQPASRDSFNMISDRSNRPSYLNRLSVAFPEKTPDQSPVTSFTSRARFSRRLMNSVSTSKVNSSKLSTANNETYSPSAVTTPSASGLTHTLSTTRVSTATQSIADTRTETQNDESKTNSNCVSNDTEMESRTDSETQGNRRSTRKRRKVCYREK